jgi:acetyltransferase
MNTSIRNFFYPSSICVAGASSKEKSIGYELLRSIKEYGYTGKIYPVNPKANEILGYKCFNSIKDIHAEIDLAIVLVPKIYVEETINELIAKNVVSIVLITAGFKEAGYDGEALEKKILKKVKDAGVRLVGPNCMGVINTFGDIKLNATFVAEKPETGRTAFFSQSGAIGAAVLNSLRETDIRFGHFISAGNKADINENDIIKFWNIDEKIETLTFYLESFSNGETFINNFLNSNKNKPVIILKAGRTSAGIKAASSHTGALANNDTVVDAVLNQFGIIRVNNLNELFNTAKGFENFPVPSGKNIAVVTNAGGPAILAVDALGKKSLSLSQLSHETKNKLKQIVHPEGSVENPVDLLPGGTAEKFKEVNEILLSDENVDGIISIFVEPIMVSAFDVIEAINSITNKKPIYQVVMPLPEFWNKYRENSVYKKFLFRNPEEPAEVISNVLFHTLRKSDREYLKQTSMQVKTFNETGFISHQLISKIAAKYNLPLTASKIIERNMINKQADGFKYPLVLKGLSKNVIHKSELNAVKLNIKDKTELLQAELEILNSFEEHKIWLEGFLVQPYLKARNEALIGGFRDPSFGPIIMFGSGGKYVEVFNDTCIKSAYISDDDIDEMIGRTNLGKILKGVRNERPVNISGLKKLIKSSAQMLLDNPDIIEFDFNPVVICTDDSLNLIDVRIKLR